MTMVFAEISFAIKLIQPSIPAKRLAHSNSKWLPKSLLNGLIELYLLIYHSSVWANPGMNHGKLDPFYMAVCVWSRLLKKIQKINFMFVRAGYVGCSGFGGLWLYQMERLCFD